jgi:hypothetical protein
MAKQRTFISFDYDHDSDIKILIVGQAEYQDSPFDIVDCSVKEPLIGDWKAKVRTRIKSASVVCVMCGEYTDTATGVAVELAIAREEKVPYFLLKGRADMTCKKPTTALPADKIYDWTWPNLKLLIGGGR